MGMLLVLISVVRVDGLGLTLGVSVKINIFI